MGKKDSSSSKTKTKSKSKSGFEKTAKATSRDDLFENGFDLKNEDKEVSDKQD